MGGEQAVISKAPGSGNGKSAAKPTEDARSVRQRELAEAASKVTAAGGAAFGAPVVDLIQVVVRQNQDVRDDELANLRQANAGDRAALRGEFETRLETAGEVHRRRVLDITSRAAVMEGMVAAAKSQVDRMESTSTSRGAAADASIANLQGKLTEQMRLCDGLRRDTSELLDAMTLPSDEPGKPPLRRAAAFMFLRASVANLNASFKDAVAEVKRAGAQAYSDGLGAAVRRLEQYVDAKLKPIAVLTQKLEGLHPVVLGVHDVSSKMLDMAVRANVDAKVASLRAMRAEQSSEASARDSAAARGHAYRREELAGQVAEQIETARTLVTEDHEYVLRLQGQLDSMLARVDLAVKQGIVAPDVAEQIRTLGGAPGSTAASASAPVVQMVSQPVDVDTVVKSVVEQLSGPMTKAAADKVTNELVTAEVSKQLEAMRPQLVEDLAAELKADVAAQLKPEVVKALGEETARLKELIGELALDLPVSGVQLTPDVLTRIAESVGRLDDLQDILASSEGS